MSIFLAGGDPKPVKYKSHKLDTRKTVFHPGHRPLKLMLILVAFEAPSGQRGVPFFVVLNACRILANNQDGTLRIVDSDVGLTSPKDDDKSLLLPGRYMYRVTTGEECYSVCTTFRAWTPPRFLPSHWSLPAMGVGAAHPPSTASTYGTVVEVADGRCAVTGDVSRLETIHLVPEGESAWWLLREMTSLTNNAGGINSPPNCLALRADLHGAGMDEGHFVFAPYKGEVVCVCLTTELADFAVEYHLRAIKMPRRIHPMNVYVRFAWGLFRGFQTLLRELSWDRSVVTIKEPRFSDIAPASKRKRSKDDDASRDDDDDDSPQESSDDNALEPPLDLDAWTERDVTMAEAIDADLDSRPLALYEQAAGMYRGYSKPIRLKYEYRKQHPEVSAVRSARVARRGEYDDEQLV
ncbi:hypothetical protein C8J57DRAFT_1717536 [Mycena rebaudengoi]|nr:hypothetical protein C8J57DRAFT_1717536 [Mycena rebaudengoi]